MGRLAAPGSVGPAARAGWRVLRGQLPDRYRHDSRAEFDRRVGEALVPGAAVLDVGSGRDPTVLPRSRPTGCRYTGLDISRSELDRAPDGSYDELVIADVAQHVPQLVARFDVAFSYQVLEHVKPLEQALENLRLYLRPGGRLVAQLSGTFSLFGLANRLIPPAPAVWLLRLLMDRDPETVFPAHYHRCWASALSATLASWSSAAVIPLWRGAPYFAFLRALQAGYVAYEEWARIAGHSNLAPYYVIDAVR